MKPGTARFPWSGFWAGFLLCLAAGMVLVLFAGLRGTAQWATVELEQRAPATWTEVVQLTLHGGETLHLAPSRLPVIRSHIHDWLTEQEQQSREQLRQTLTQGHAALLARTLEQVPRYADWHYSLAGEYARLLHAAVGDLPAFLTERMLEHVFEPAGVTDAMDTWLAELDTALARELRLGTESVNDRLLQLAREQAVDETDSPGLRILDSRAPGTDLHARLEPRLGLSPEDLARQGVAASAGALAGAVAMKKLGLATAGKLGLKAAGGALAGTGGGAVTGAALCGASVVAAPLAAGCAVIGGVVAGIGTWLLVDKGALEAEAYLRRDRFEAALREAIEAEFARLLAALEQRYLAALDSGFDQLRRGVDVLLQPAGEPPDETFVPARVIGNGRDRE